MKLMDLNVMDFANDISRKAMDCETRQFELLDIDSVENPNHNSTVYFAEVAVRVMEEDGRFWQHDRIELEIDTHDQTYKLTSHPQRGYCLAKRVLVQSTNFDDVSSWIDENIQNYTI